MYREGVSNADVEPHNVYDAFDIVLASNSFENFFP